MMQKAHVTGTGLAIFGHGEIAYLKTYGLRDTKKDLPLTPDSVMTSASLSKSAFAAVVMRLVQEHRLETFESLRAEREALLQSDWFCASTHVRKASSGWSDSAPLARSDARKPSTFLNPLALRTL